MKLKELTEKRNAAVEEMKAITELATTENRSVSEDEITKWDTLDEEVKSLDKEIKMEERSRNLKLNPAVTEEKKTELTAEEVEVRSFANYIRDKAGVAVETRDGEQNLNMSNNGAVIPTTIAQKVISTVKEMCPIFAKATMYNTKGTLKIPVYGLSNTTHDITVAFQSEFTDITADVGQFTSVDLTGFLAGALSLIGKSVANSSDIDVTTFIVKEMAKKIALFLETKLLNGEASYNEGALATTTTLNAGSTSAVSADNLISLQAKIPTIYQKNAAWTMAPATFTAIRKLKDGNGQYLLQSNFSQDFPYAILGKPVYISDAMPAIGSANKAILYGDYAGLSVNMRENVTIQILLEKYATMHALGVVSWFEFDSKISDHQQLATLVMSV